MAEPGDRLTVLMTVHNGRPFVRTAIESILQQTFSSFRFLIVDDASTDGTREVIHSYRDPRIELVCLEHNVGQTAALNIGLRQISTPWIARMDADDFSAPTRLEEQMRSLELNPSLDCVGTFAWMFRNDPQVVERVVEKPIDDAAIKYELLRSTPMIHGSLLVKREALMHVGGYDERYRYSADRELYYRLLPRCRAANIPKRLLGARQHRMQGSVSLRAAIESVEILSHQLSLPCYSDEEKTVLREGLSFAYRYRAQCQFSGGQYVSMLHDLFQAFRLSPRTLMSVVGRSIVPARCRSVLQSSAGIGRFSSKDV